LEIAILFYFELNYYQFSKDYREIILSQSVWRTKYLPNICKYFDVPLQVLRKQDEVNARVSIGNKYNLVYSIPL